MINLKDQEILFRLIAKHLSEDVRCWAFGGTAMMFYGYKAETKDIDLFFEENEEREKFIAAIKKLGFEETSPLRIYIPEKLRDKHRPLMFSKEDARLDLFAKKIIHTVISPKMKEDKFAVHEFKENKILTLNVLRKEHIIMLKAVTERDRDFEDIITIVQKEKDIGWQYLVDEVIWQFRHGDSWVLMDTIKMLHELKKYAFVKSDYIRQLADALGEKDKEYI